VVVELERLESPTGHALSLDENCKKLYALSLGTEGVLIKVTT
jgi:hypothetical protein